MQARDADAGDAQAALDTLCRIYRPPVLAFIRRRGYDPATAEDLAQEFFVHFIDRTFHANADPARGRFRNFLLTALKHFLFDAESGARAIKRGGGLRFSPLEPDNNGDREVLHVAGTDSPEQAFEREWAVALLSSALAQLRAEAANSGKLELFDALVEFVAERANRADYARVAEATHLHPNTIAVAVYRLRKRLRELVREEMAQTTAGPAAFAGELQHLDNAMNSLRLSPHPAVQKPGTATGNPRQPNGGQGRARNRGDTRP